MPGQTVTSRNHTLRSHFGDDRHPTLSIGTLWFALLRGSPVAGGTEPDGTGGYTRISKVNDATLWGTISSSAVAIANTGASGAIVWPSTTGLYSVTEPLTWWGAYTLSAGGVLRYFGQLQQTIMVTGAGQVPRIPAGALTLDQLE